MVFRINSNILTILRILILTFFRGYFNIDISNYMLNTIIGCIVQYDRIHIFKTYLK